MRQLMLMAFVFGAASTATGVDREPRAPLNTSAAVAAGSNRTVAHGGAPRQLWTPRYKVSGIRLLQSPSWTRSLCFCMIGASVCLSVGYMFQPAGGAAQGSLRLPPRWEPNMEGSLPFRTWMQDLMLWTICTDLAPPQQCAAIISQLGGQARELARTLTPTEVYQGGMVAGVHLDPVSFLLHGLQARFAPLDEETRLRAAQDLLSFNRRGNETVDTLISRFEIVRGRAQAAGGGAVSVETAALLLLRACGVSSEQFQTLTQPFGLRLPTTDPEFAQMTHHLRRLGHIVERFPNNIASGIRPAAQTHQAYVTEADTGSSAGDVWPLMPFRRRGLQLSPWIGLLRQCRQIKAIPARTRLHRLITMRP